MSRFGSRVNPSTSKPLIRHEKGAVHVAAPFLVLSGLVAAHLRPA